MSSWPRVARTASATVAEEFASQLLKFSPGTWELKDANGALIESSGNLTYSGGSVGRAYIGLTQAAASVNAQIDALVIDNAVKPAPIVAATHATHFCIRGGVLVPMSVAGLG